MHILPNCHLKPADHFVFSSHKNYCSPVTQLWLSSFCFGVFHCFIYLAKRINCFWHQLESGIRYLSPQEEWGWNPPFLWQLSLLLVQPFPIYLEFLDPIHRHLTLPLSWMGYLRVDYSSICIIFWQSSTVLLSLEVLVWSVKLVPRSLCPPNI